MRRKSQAEGAQRLIESGMLDDLFAKIDAGGVQLDGDGGFIQQLIKTGLERGLQAELTVMSQDIVDSSASGHRGHLMSQDIVDASVVGVRL